MEKIILKRFNSMKNDAGEILIAIKHESFSHINHGL